MVDFPANWVKLNIENHTTINHKEVNMRVDRNIAVAITQYLEENNMAAKDLCEMLEVSQPAFVKWRRPGKGITVRYWEKLFPLIKKYLPAERMYVDASGQEQYSSMLEGTGCHQYFQPRYIPQMVPVFTIEEIEQYPYVTHNIEQFAIDNDVPRIEYRPRSKGCGAGVFAMQVDFKTGVIPVDALVFISAEIRPKNGSTVLFRDAPGVAQFGRYAQVDDRFSITCGRTVLVSGSLNQIRHLVQWIFPVMYYEVVTF